MYIAFRYNPPMMDRDGFWKLYPTEVEDPREELPEGKYALWDIGDNGEEPPEIPAVDSDRVVDITPQKNKVKDL